jgi:hypothetical protein
MGLLLKYAHVCSRMLTYAHVCSRMLTYAHVCSRMLMHAHACSRMWRTSGGFYIAEDDAAGSHFTCFTRTQFTCFTSTRVQILMPEGILQKSGRWMRSWGRRWQCGCRCVPNLPLHSTEFNPTHAGAGSVGAGVLILLYMCPHTAICVSSYCYICAICVLILV